MTFVISGATGFIGRKLVDFLLSQGHSVNYLGRQRSSKMDTRAAFHSWSPGEEAPLNSVPRSDAIIHLAGEPISQRWNAEVKKRIYDSRINSTRSLVKAIGKLQHKPSVLVNASAVGYYGERGDEILTESSSPGQGFLAEVCVDWEREAFQALEFGLRVAPIRTGVVLGTDGGALKQMLLPFRLGVGGELGSGKAWMPWIHVHDLVRLIAFTAQNDSLHGPVNGASPSPVTNAEFTRSLAHQLHRPSLFRVPKFALKMALGEMAEFATQSLRVIPQAGERAGFAFAFPELGGALKDLLK